MPGDGLLTVVIVPNPIENRYKETVTCWYHGFTYNWQDGKLVTILTDPDNELIGKLRIKSYAVEEVKGLVFVFVGDIDPPPLADDLPPDFFDAGREIHGRRIPVKANWRWGTENGIDSSHLYIHRNSKLLDFTNVFIPLGIVAKPDHDK